MVGGWGLPRGEGEGQGLRLAQVAHGQDAGAQSCFSGTDGGGAADRIVCVIGVYRCADGPQGPICRKAKPLQE